jgi:two-component system OmpR family sensor kinase
MALPIRARLAVVCGALVGGLVLGLAAIVYLRLEADLRAAADDGLLSRAEAIDQDPANVPDGSTLAVSPSDVGDIFGQVLMRDGRVVATTPGIATDGLVATTELGSISAPHYFDAVVPIAGDRVLARLLVMPAADGRVILVGVAFDDQREALDRLLFLFGLAGPATVVLAGAVGWFVAGAALRPVERMRVESEVISGSEPGRRLPVPPSRDELAALGGSLNRMLDRLEAAVERERRFVADASHELRTPLANLKAELDLALRRARSPAELVDALRSASEETDRLSRLAEDLLLLAGAAGGLPMRREDVDVAQLVHETVESFGGRAAQLGVALEASIEPGLRAHLDGPRIRQALGNLIENALRQTPAGGRVTVAASRWETSLTILVSDTGEGFAPSYLPDAFEAFTRAEASRSRPDGGAGLGLAIVRAIAEAHGGTVEAMNRDEGGAVVMVRVPA